MILAIFCTRYQVFDFRMKSLEDHNDQAAVSKYHINAPWLANRTAASSRMPSEKLESLYIHN